ncbi:conserved hypothetical protein [Leptothrix cholodnii SP-6]|uniref:DUF3617 domain-containing protein n=1 Tax=Leptothrix cholodnii (strain ATCC 51168 / LMG 8142 / SP-6) TaxID=395495 RepID=B1XYK2_LEPCP|nr:DUF3617 domain-containing protein [Leptothrix cholodnii]ACB36438.1 conserved hypothetical protein [Leptothrix cholodnii SP-6]
MKFTVGWAVLAASALWPVAQAQTHKVQPGLWENQVTIQTGDPVLDQMAADMQARLAGLPPEQRQMVEQMMAARGVRMGARPNTLQACITPEQAARDELPQQSEQCQQLEAQRDGNTIKVKFTCETSPPAKGEGEFTLISPTRYSGRTRVDTVVQGQPAQVNILLSGRWMGADCKAAPPARPGRAP